MDWPPVKYPAVPDVVVADGAAGFEVYICPPLTTATSLLPSDEEATEYQFLLLSRAVQLTPESAEL